jgi:hypothetical protein
MLYEITVLNNGQTRHPDSELHFLLDCSVATHVAAALCIGDAHECCVYRTDWGGRAQGIETRARLG